MIAMSSLLRLLAAVLLLIGQVSAAAPAAQASDDPDRLYAEREDITKALAAANIWERRLAANAGDFESAWKLARASYWIGTQGPEPQRRTTLEQGVTAGRAATPFG